MEKRDIKQKINERLEKELKIAGRIQKYIYEKSGYYEFGKAHYYDFPGKEIVIAADWNSLPDKLYNYIDNELEFVHPTFLDEIATCSHCGKIVSTVPDSAFWEPNYIIDDEYGELICRECIEENPDLLIDICKNRIDKAVPSWGYDIIKKAGFSCIDSEGGSCKYFNNGFHYGNDTPEEILEEFAEEFGFELGEKFDYVWFINSADCFQVKFSLWIREK